MGRVVSPIVGGLVFWALGWLVLAGLVQLDLDNDSFRLQGHVPALLFGVLGLMPPIVTLAAILGAFKNLAADSLLKKLTSGKAHQSFALYLRAFDYDMETAGPGHQFEMVTHALDSLWKSDRSLSAFVASLLKRNGAVEQVVAIKRPAPGASFTMEDLNHGAGVIEAKGSEWRDVVVQLARQAKVIVIAAAASDGVQWEFEQLRAFGVLRRTVLIVPPELRGLSVSKRMQVLEWVRTFGATPPGDLDAGFAVTFDGQGQAHRVWPLEISESGERKNTSGLSAALVYASNPLAHVGEGTRGSVSEKLATAVEAVENVSRADVLDAANYAAELEEHYDNTAALEQYRLALKLSRERFGDDAVHTLQVKANFEHLLALYENARWAQKVLAQDYELKSRVRGETDALTLAALKEVIAPTVFLGNFEEAKGFAAALVGRTGKKLGNEHPDTKAALDILVAVQFRISARADLEKRRARRLLAISHSSPSTEPPDP